MFHRTSTPDTKATKRPSPSMAICSRGDFPRKQRKLVEAWVLLHAEELEADWELAFNLEHPFRIDPLR